jgi:Flp pilus assembly protein TadD
MTSSEPALGLNSDNKTLANNSRDLVDRARAARAGGENEAAVRLYRSAISVTPPDGGQQALRLELGELLLQMQQTNDAFLVVTQAIDAATDDATRARGYVVLGHVLQRLNRYAESVVLYEMALALNPGSPRALVGRGVALDRQGMHEQAQASYQDALAIEPENVSAMNNLALSYAFAGNFAKAVEILHPMATAPGATPQLRQNLALVYGLMGNQELAASISRRDLDEATVRANLRFYEQLRRMPNPAEALAGAAS